MVVSYTGTGFSEMKQKARGEIWKRWYAGRERERCWGMELEIRNGWNTCILVWEHWMDLDALRFLIADSKGSSGFACKKQLVQLV